MTDTLTPETQTETVQLSVSDGTTLSAYVARPASGGSKAGLRSADTGQTQTLPL